MTFLLNALVVVGAIILSVLLIMLVKLVRPSHQAQPQPETDLELGALPAATILVTSNSHVWAKQEVSQVSHSQVSVDSKNQTSSQSSGGGVFQAEPGSSEESDQGRLHSPTSTGIAVLPRAGTLQCNAFEEVKLSSKEESAASVLTQVPNQEISSGVDAFQGEVGTSEEDFDECQSRSPKGAGIAALPSNLQSSTLEAEEATESSPSVDKSATSILTQVPNQEISSGVDAFQGEVGTSEEDFDECQSRSPKGAGVAALPFNLQSSILEAEEATESSPSVDKSAASVLTQVPNEKSAGGEVVVEPSFEEAAEEAASDQHDEGDPDPALQSSVPKAEEAEKPPGVKGGKAVTIMERSSSEESGERVGSEEEEGGIQCGDPFEEGKAKISLANCDKILDNLYLGGVEAVGDHDQLTSQGVRAICVCCREFEIPSKSFVPTIEYYRVDVEDMSKEPLEFFLEEATDFIHSWHSQNVPVLVHCRAGVSRSASVVLAYMVRFANFNLNDAFVYLRAARPAVTPNLGFMEKLVAYEEEIHEGEGTIDTRKYESWFTFQASSPVAIPDLKPDEV